MNNYDYPTAKSSEGGKTRFLLVSLFVILGIGLSLAGFLAGRATAPVSNLPQTPPTTAVEQVIGESEAATDAPTAELPTAVVALTGNAAELMVVPSPTATPTDPPPTPEPPTAVPTDEPEPTEEPTPESVVEDISPLTEADLSTLYEAWRVIAEQYDGEMPPLDEIIDSLIAGSLRPLDDDYTRYVSPDIAKRMREDDQGEIEGIGAFVKENDDGLFEIVRPMDGQPADLAGVKAGDILIEIDGQSVIELSFDEVIQMVRGPRDSQVDLTFIRNGEPVEFTIVRARFEVPVVEFSILPEEMTGEARIGYIHLTEFNLLAKQRVNEAIVQLYDQGATSLIFDLRDNPGGFLHQSVAVADAFLPQGIALYERNNRGMSEEFHTFDGDIAETIPLVVLINSASASASEIVAGAIQDRGRAVLIGETTFGKGSVQMINTLTNGSELRVTIARWFTPNNNSIDGVGITPDIEVETPDTLGGLEDGQLMRAVEYLLSGN